MADKFQNKYRITSSRLKNWDYRTSAAYFITICTANRTHFFGEIVNQKMVLSNTGVIADILWHHIPNHAPNVSLGEFVVMPNHIHGILILNQPDDGDANDIDGFINFNDKNDLNLVDDYHVNDDCHVVDDFGNKNDLNVVHGFHVKDDCRVNDKFQVNDGLIVETLHATSLQPNQPNQPNQSNQSNQPNQSIKSDQSIQSNDSKNQFMADISPKSNSVSTIIRSYKSAVTKHANRLGLQNGWQPRFHDHIIRNDAEYQRIANYINNNPAQWQEDKFYTIYE